MLCPFSYFLYWWELFFFSCDVFDLIGSIDNFCHPLYSYPFFFFLFVDVVERSSVIRQLNTSNERKLMDAAEGEESVRCIFIRFYLVITLIMAGRLVV